MRNATQMKTPAHKLARWIGSDGWRAAACARMSSRFSWEERMRGATEISSDAECARDRAVVFFGARRVLISLRSFEDPDHDILCWKIFLRDLELGRIFPLAYAHLFAEGINRPELRLYAGRVVIERNNDARFNG